MVPGLVPVPGLENELEKGDGIAGMKEMIVNTVAMGARKEDAGLILVPDLDLRKSVRVVLRTKEAGGEPRSRHSQLSLTSMMERSTAS